MKFQLVQKLILNTGEWISRSDIGNHVDEVMVTEEVCDAIEREVIDFINLMMKKTNSAAFYVEEFECWPNAASSLGAEAEDLQRFWSLLAEVKLADEVLESMIRLAYRQLIWLKMVAVGTAGSVWISFGQDGNLQVTIDASETDQFAQFRGRYLTVIEQAS